MSRQGSFLKITISIIIVLIVVLYTIFNTRLIIKGPVIEIYDLYDGQTIEEDLIDVRGSAKNISFISLNGRQIFINENSEFNENLLLTNNVNVINIYAEDKFGKVEEKKIRLIKPNQENHEEKIDWAVDLFEENKKMASSTEEENNSSSTEGYVQ